MATSLAQEIAVNFTGALAYGLYLATFLACLRWLLFADEGWKLRRNIRWVILTVTILILVCNTTYLSWSLNWAMVKATHVVNEPEVAYAVPQWANIISCTAANLNVLLADIVLIHRCWVIYDHRRMIVIFPIFLWLGGLVCTVLQIYLQVAHMMNPNIGPYLWASVDMTLGPGIVLMPFWICTVILNAYSPAVLIHRIYQTAKEIGPHTSVKHLYFVVWVIAESGILYLSITLAHFLVWFGSSKFAIDIISVLNAPIIGIAFNWFLIRLAKNRAREAKREAVQGDTS